MDQGISGVRSAKDGHQKRYREVVRIKEGEQGIIGVRSEGGK